MEMLGQKVSKEQFGDQAGEQQEVPALNNIAGAKILLAEDSEINQAVAAELLKQAGMRVTIANNGREAVEKSGLSAFDCVLMDCQMPVMDGYEATRAIRKDKRFGSLPIIAITANAAREDRKKCLDAGMDDHIAKPLNREDMFAALVKWIPAKEPGQDQEGPMIPPEEIEPAPDEKLIPNIYGIDNETGLARLSGNDKLYRKMLLKFYLDNKNIKTEIDGALGKGDLPAAERLIHTIKGVAATLGADELAKLAEPIEINLGNKKDVESPLWEKFWSEFGSVRRSLKQLAPDDGPDQDNGIDYSKTTMPPHLVNSIKRNVELGMLPDIEQFYPEIRKIGPHGKQLAEKIGDLADKFDSKGILGILKSSDQVDLPALDPDSRVLIVDDAPVNLAILKEALADESFKLAFANSGENALEIAPRLRPNLILLDIVMPGINGYETCARLKQDPKTKDIPVIFITAKKETGDIVKGFQAGGADYITKPFQKEEVCARVRNHLELRLLRKQNEEKMKATMARYLGSDVVDTLMESGQEVMATSEQDATILFSDIRGFTSLTEELGKEETVGFLREYFSLMVNCVHYEKGMLDKFIGDAIMAVFGAPVQYDDHADRGVKSAISMMKTLDKFNGKRKSLGQPPVKIGIGLNTAPVISGNIGSPDRMDYTVIGDGVNIASRVENACKYYGSGILICEYTVNALKKEYKRREIDRVFFKGKTKPTRVFEILDYHTEETFPNLEEVLGLFKNGLEQLREGNLNEALTNFEKALELNPSDRVSQIYVERCEKLINNPPGKDWDGIWEIEYK